LLELCSNTREAGEPQHPDQLTGAKANYLSLAKDLAICFADLGKMAGGGNSGIKCERLGAPHFSSPEKSRDPHDSQVRRIS
jgi:hypothetical protein